ncbi:MAG: Skp family chaperone for outer membrane protein [Psychromonas sp.]|jgi:Skp family chaperone for outer membrane proteins
MKNIIALAAVVVLIASCGKKETKSGEGKVPMNVEQKQIGELKIAFYFQDSLKAKFGFYVEQDKQVQAKQIGFQKEVERMTKDYQGFLERNDERARQGLLSQIQIQQIQQEAAAREQKIMQYQQAQGGRIEQETMIKLDDIGKKIESYSRKYCEENGIDILMVQAKGGQFGFITPTMDVTSSFIQYLNEQEAAIKKDLGK